MKCGGDLEALNLSGETPLLVAVSPEHPSGFWKEETMRVLLERGANPNVLNSDGYSCLNMADHANVTRMLSRSVEQNNRDDPLH